MSVTMAVVFRSCVHAAMVEVMTWHRWRIFRNKCHENYFPLSKWSSAILPPTGTRRSAIQNITKRNMGSFLSSKYSQRTLHGSPFRPRYGYVTVKYELYSAFVVSALYCISCYGWQYYHYSDVIMNAIYSTVYSGADHRKYQSSAILVFV